MRRSKRCARASPCEVKRSANTRLANDTVCDSNISFQDERACPVIRRKELSHGRARYIPLTGHIGTNGEHGAPVSYSHVEGGIADLRVFKCAEWPNARSGSEQNERTSAESPATLDPSVKSFAAVRRFSAPIATSSQANRAAARPSG